MSELNDKLLEIKRQKDEYILPENIKKDVTVYGVTGTLESGSGGVKLFSTVAEMEADKDADIGEKAVVCKKEFLPTIEGQTVSKIKLPQTVTLPAQWNTGEYGYRVYWRDEKSMVKVDGDFSQQNGYLSIELPNDTNISMQWESNDGIIYTSDSSSMEIDASLTLGNIYGAWTDNLGYFILGWLDNFQGLYEYNNVLDNDTLIMYKSLSYKPSDNSIEFIYQNTYNFPIGQYWNLIDNIIYNEVGLRAYYTLFTIYNELTNILDCYIFRTTDSTSTNTQQPCIYIDKNENKLYFIGFDVNSNYFEKVSINLVSETYTREQIVPTDIVTINNYRIVCELPYDDNLIYGSISGSNNKPLVDSGYGFILYGYTNNGSVGIQIIPWEYGTLSKYIICDTQLSASKEYVYEKLYYGKDGVQKGTLGNKNIDGDGLVAKAEILAAFKDLILEDESLAFKFQGKSGIYEIPAFSSPNLVNCQWVCNECADLVTVGSFDSSSVTNFYYAFSVCPNLVNFPQLDFSSATNLNSMFTGTESLSAESLNNILASCVTVGAAYTRPKTLVELGLSQTQATTCQSLSNWSAFVNAGWTTGY